jgi:hypothetical protein
MTHIPIILTVGELTALTEQVTRDIEYWTAVGAPDKARPWLKLLGKFQAAFVGYHEVNHGG